ncbi:ATP-binding cassette domain-containing protein [Herbiconiux ginsengi]|uniref:Ribose transport system ATP-binding protein n=1 Tax=Herbiconiux ginsengi TaxID=381665 RepID=A0A1H3NEN8_9MICO|nr:ATP-binding cassette domain-containing protein [Herbiconiux ginsengi]SDY87130.1 ribose transport system ATP-binding protein [Herbiconiux ginsengi]
MTHSTDAMMMTEKQTTEVVLSTDGVSKQYGPVTALTEMSLAVRAGEVRALVGENGSGKSTFVGIVSGTVVPNTGTVTIADRALTKHLPVESQSAGVLTVFQDGSLLATLTVAQNLYIGTPAAQRPKYAEIVDWAAARLAEHDLDLDPMLKVAALAPGDRQILEIVRAVMAKPRLLLLDESTSALDASGVDKVLDLMRLAALQGCAVLFVTHRLAEVFRVADTVSILRDGRFIGTHPAAEVSPKQIVELMAGTKVEMEFPARAPLDVGAKELLTARGLAGEKFGPVDLTLRAGQVLGIAGADGNGQGQLLRGLATLGVSGGTVTSLGTELRNYRQATRDGIVFLSGDRKNESLFQALSIRENMTAGVLRKLSTAGVVSAPAERRFVNKQIADFGIRLGSPSQPPSSLSGGNQQKIAISKAMAAEPKVFLIDEPTQGVDVRSRMDIYRFIRACADAGNAVVIVSSDASELAGVADRIIVMSRGRIIEDMPGLGSDEESIVGAFAVESRVVEGDGEPVSGPSAGLDATETATEAQPQASSRPPAAARRARLPRWVRNEETTRLAVLALLMLAIGAVTAAQNPTFLSELSLKNVLLIATPLTAVAIAQYFVLLVGGIDVSVGATMSLSVVVMSYLVNTGGVFPNILIAIGAAIALGVVVGLINAWLVERMKLSAVIATIATLGIVTGVALTLRPTPGGNISYELMSAITRSIGIFPIALLVLAVLVIAGDILLRRTGLGLRVRAVGINGLYANRLGIRATAIRGGAYVLCAVLAAIAGVLLAAQVGIGDASVGEIYTLLAIAAPVIGGASLLGGRGTLIGALLGAVMLALLMTLATVLRISQGVNLLFIGGITLIALLTYVLPLKRRNSVR